MMRKTTTLGRPIALAAALLSLLVGCGQRGPLTLPDSAQPAQRQSAPATTEPQDDERENER